MGQSASEEITIAASPEEVWEVIVDLDAYPEWAEGMKRVEVLERDADGRPLRARFLVDARVMEVTYTLQYRYEPTERITWHLVEGQQVRKLDGEYQLTGRDGATHTRYTLEVDVDLPLPGFMKKRAAKVIMETGLKGLKRRVESG